MTPNAREQKYKTKQQSMTETGLETTSGKKGGHWKNPNMHKLATCDKDTPGKQRTGCCVLRKDVLTWEKHFAAGKKGKDLVD